MGRDSIFLSEERIVYELLKIRPLARQVITHIFRIPRTGQKKIGSNRN